jgi:integrase
MRTADEMERILDKYILPRWGTLPFVSIKRSKFNELLNEIEDAHGAHMADNVAAVLRSIGTWYRDVGDDYVSPFAGVKKRVPEHKRSRDRTLDDAEIAAVWKAAGAPDAGAYGSLLRLLLLTGQRLSVVVGMKWSDIENGVWTIRKSHPREKENGGKLKLPKLALNIIDAMPRFIGDDDVFAKHRSYCFTDLKKRFDERCGVTGWRTHDLRRSARTLMSRAKVDRAIAERVLGHAIPGVEGVYDRHGYLNEKSDALRKLAAQITEIVRPPAPKPKRKRQPKADNVVQLRAAS